MYNLCLGLLLIYDVTKVRLGHLTSTARQSTILMVGLSPNGSIHVNLVATDLAASTSVFLNMCVYTSVYIVRTCVRV